MSSPPQLLKLEIKGFDLPSFNYFLIVHTCTNTLPYATDIDWEEDVKFFQFLYIAAYISQGFLGVILWRWIAKEPEQLFSESSRGRKEFVRYILVRAQGVLFYTSWRFATNENVETTDTGSGGCKAGNSELSLQSGSTGATQEGFHR